MCSAEAQALQGQKAAAGFNLKQQQRRAEGEGVRLGGVLCHHLESFVAWFKVS